MPNEDKKELDMEGKLQDIHRNQYELAAELNRLQEMLFWGVIGLSLLIFVRGGIDIGAK